MIPGFPCVTPGVKSFSSYLRRVGRWNLVCVECLQMIKSIVVGFCFIGS